MEKNERAKIQRETVRAVLNLLQFAAEDFYYNRPNDYGGVKAMLWTGAGNPWETMRGDEIIGNFRDGKRGTGRYLLNEAAIDFIVARILDVASDY